MAKVRLTQRARTDLRDIADWIAHDDPRIALSFAAELRAACEDLKTFPRAYPADPRYGPNARRRTYGKYHIIYDALDDRIVVLAIVHAARDPNAFP